MSDGGSERAYAGKLVTWAKKPLKLTSKTVARPKDTSGFVLCPAAGAWNERPG